MTASRPTPVTLETAHLLLRPWRESDLEPFAEMSVDPEVMHFFPSMLDHSAIQGVYGRVTTHFAREGWGLFAVEVRGGPAFAGFCGMQRVPFDAPFTPAVEIGWRLSRAAWGHGYATEGARACLAFAWNVLALPEVVAMVVPENVRSRAVCERLGMTLDPAADFDHPRIPEGSIAVGGMSPRRHVLYRIQRAA